MKNEELMSLYFIYLLKFKPILLQYSLKNVHNTTMKYVFINQDALLPQITT